MAAIQHPGAGVPYNGDAVQIVPLLATPSQSISVQLGGQACTLDIYQKSTGVFMDVYVNDALIIGGVACENKNRIVHSTYLGFIGDLAFFDTQGADDPDYTGMGTRWILLYLGPGDIVWPGQALASTPAFVPLPIPPSAPTGFVAAPAFEQNTLTWTEVAGMTYNLYWATAPGVTTTTGTKIAGVASGYVHAGLSDNTTYYYVLEVNDAYGNSALSSEVSGLTLPAAPTGLSAVADATTAINVSLTQEVGLTYNLYWSIFPSVTPSTGTKVTGFISPYNLPGLTPGSTYYFVATAVNATGEGPVSTEVNVATPLPVLAVTTQTIGYTVQAQSSGALGIAFNAASGKYCVEGYYSGSYPLTENTSTGLTGSWGEIQPATVNSMFFIQDCGSFITIGGYAGTPYFNVWVSADGGVSWTTPATPSGMVGGGPVWPGGAWNGSVAVILGNLSANTSYTQDTCVSADGATWTYHPTVLPSSGDWSACVGILSGAHVGTFVAAKKNSQDIAVSSDGITWASYPGALPAAFASGSNPIIVEGNGILLAFSGASTNQIARSTDGGLTWALVTMPSTAQWRMAAWTGLGFVAITSDTTKQIGTSVDGVTWAAHTSPSSVGYMWAIASNIAANGFLIVRNNYAEVDLGTYS